MGGRKKGVNHFKIAQEEKYREKKQNCYCDKLRTKMNQEKVGANRVKKIKLGGSSQLGTKSRMK